MRPAVSHHLVMSLSMSISEGQLNKTPCRRVLVLPKWKSFLARAYQRGGKISRHLWLAKAYLTPRWSGVNKQLNSKLRHSRQRLNLNGCSHCLTGGRGSGLFDITPWTWNWFLVPEERETAMQQSASITIRNRDNCPPPSPEEAEAVRKTAMHAIVKTPHSVLRFNIASRDSSAKRCNVEPFWTAPGNVQPLSSRMNSYTNVPGPLSLPTLQSSATVWPEQCFKFLKSLTGW